MAGGLLSESGLPGEVFVWHDILYDGPRKPGWPDDKTLQDRALFLERETGGGLKRADIRDTLRAQYRKLAAAGDFERVILWFDACLFDQAMLVHVLTGLRFQGAQRVDLLVIDAFPGIVPFDGLGQMRPHELASVFNRRREVTEAQYRYAERADKAFALQDRNALAELAAGADAPLPWVPAAAERWLLEQPDPKTGLGRLESLALEAVRSGLEKPTDILTSVAAADSHPRYWGDTTLWTRINGLVERNPPCVRISGPKARLPQWGDSAGLSRFTIFPV